MRIIILSSGSSGNSTYVEMGGKKLLIDVGISYRKIENELAKLRMAVHLLDGILITHSHDDHIRGLKTLLAKATVPLYMGEGTLRELAERYKLDLRHYPYLHILNGNCDIFAEDSGLRVLPMRTSHDVQSFGFYLEAVEGNLVYVTDTGFLPKCYGLQLYDRDYYIFESNYDPEMLRTCKYTNYVKSRINSPQGHMSNEYSAHCTSSLVGPHTKKVVLAHISENSNTAELALGVHRRAMQEASFPIENIVCATQRCVLTVVDEDSGNQCRLF